MAQSKITLIGMERFLNPDHSVFDDLTLPEGIDKDTLVGTILLRCQEFELLYADPEFMTVAVNVWGRKNYWTFDRWIKAINAEYNPLYNKDYYESWKDTHEGEFSKEGSGSSSGNNKQTNNLLETDDHSQINDLSHTNDITLTHSEKAYNSGSSFVETTKDVTDQDQTQTGTVRNAGTTANTGTVQNIYGDNESNSESGDDSYTNEHSYHGYGNIGVTSAQSLLKQELDVAKFNLYNQIADLFASEFCIMIY